MSKASRSRWAAWRALAFVLLALSAGCSAIPPGEPAPAAPPAREDALQAVLAPVQLELNAEEAFKGYSRESVEREFSGGQQLLLADWCRHDATGLAGVRAGTVELADSAAALQDAWDQGDDLLLAVRIREFRTEFEGHNGWWLPNVVLWLHLLIPSWFVATEDYALSFEAELEVRSVDTKQLLHRSTHEVRVSGSFDEFDRGWQILGFLYPLNDRENWLSVARALLPAARTRLGRALGRELRLWSEELATPPQRAQLRKTLALVVGVSHYADGRTFPELAGASQRARQVGAALEAGGVRFVAQLDDEEATRAAMLARLDALCRRLRAGDRLLLYFAGYGSRTAGGVPSLLLHDAQPPREGPRGSLDFAELRERLAEVPAGVLWLLDCDFDGQGRSFLPPAGFEPVRPDLGAASALFATSPGGPFLALDHRQGSLFGFHLERGLRGAADRNGNDRITLRELFQYTRDQTIRDSARLQETAQRPYARLSGEEFELKVPLPATGEE